MSTNQQILSDPCITLHKVNGIAGGTDGDVEDIVVVEQPLCRQATPMPSSMSGNNPRPATLILRSVFPSEEH